MLSRRPIAALRPFVETLWATRPPDPPRLGGTVCERVLPTGLVHVVFRLSNEPLRLYAGPEDAAGTAVGSCLVGGARAEPYLRDVSRPTASVGALLRPGAARLLFGVPAQELAGRHTDLGLLWGAGAAEEARERLAEVETLEARIDLLESLLAARLPRVRGLHPAVAAALARFDTAVNVGQAVAESGYSHRRFNELFRRDVGLPPKLYARVRRFQGALDRFRANSGQPWAELAAASGYADQAHLSREFRELAGLSPGAYRRAGPVHANHVPLDGPSAGVPGSTSFKTPRVAGSILSAGPHEEG